ncbi:MAG: hypothetical protein ACRD3I_13740, partial [Terriglobales bacterium]
MGELPHQARFAHSGFAYQGHDLPVPGVRTFESGEHLRKLGAAPDELGQPARRGSLQARADGGRTRELEDFHRVAKPLDW